MSAITTSPTTPTVISISPPKKLGAHPWIAGSIAVLYLILAFGRSITDRPICDEGWFADPAYHLLVNGRMQTTSLESVGTGWDGLDRHTYWILPLHSVVQAGWYKLMGFGLFQMRFLSVLWGLVALAAWYFIMRATWNDDRLALLTVGLLAVDFAFVRSAANGRMDMMAAALAFSGFAAYLSLRSENLTRALFISQAFLACACITHPNALPACLSMAFLVALFDIRRIRFQHLIAAGIPYLAAAAGFGLYVMQDPHLFVRQMSGNAATRLWGLVTPLSAMKAELADRYLGLSGMGPQASKIVLFVPYFAGIVLSLLIPSIRGRKAYAALAGCLAIYALYFTFFEGTKLYLYMVHIIPFYVAILAVVIHYFWSARSVPRWTLAACVLALAVIQIGATTYVFHRDSYRNSYLPAAAFLKTEMSPGSLIFGGSDLAFQLGFVDNLRDDERFGYYSRRRAEFIVLDERYKRDIQAMRRKYPDIYGYIANLLAEQYRPVYEHGTYTIYKHR